ncbi:MAG: glycosyltransferase family 4 protein [Patescibacteria group bacterium]|nr:glycosyltransferase family 4 protein [Patescibacteria group bacterium]
MPQPKSPCVLYVSTFPPRECGIATFCQDLTNAIDKEFSPAVKSKILAMNVNDTSLYNYSKKVCLQISDNDLEDYLQRANDINNSPDIKLVNIQHEYGIYGGEWGNYVLPFMEMIKKPIIVTFHTVLPRPSRDLKKITRQILSKASGAIVMTDHSANLLKRTYMDANLKRPIAIIPHGVHHIPYPSKTKAKEELNLSGKIVLSTFGMLNSDKGIEYAIEALPKIVEKYPNVIYLVLGATHPVVVRHEGERYRNKLVKLVTKLKLENNVKFYNKYLELPELIDFLRATDVYISPTLNPKQAVSGTISYAFSCACPIVSTANQYAKDTINRERGILVDFANAKAIETALMTMLDDHKMRVDMKKNAYYYSRHMTWQNVALAYFKFFDQFTPIIPRDKDKLPEINLGHVKKLTDDFGMIQFAKHTKPDIHSGYCLDDNARALIGCVSYYNRVPKKTTLDLINTYYRYLKYSQKTSGAFKDFINRTGEVEEDRDLESQDSFGRAIWCLGEVINAKRLPVEIVEGARDIFNKAYPLIVELKFSRSIAFSIIGLANVWKFYGKIDDKNKQEEIRAMIARLVDTLVSRFHEQSADAALSGQNWLWFDDHLTYSNYKIPEALFRSAEILNDKKVLTIAKTSIDFLNTITFEKGYYNAIGQDGWYFRNGKRAYFDQQPEDAATAVEALVAAFEATNNDNYAVLARDAFQWFLGKNHLNQMIYDEATGGCYDGLGKHSINFNQGAESTISYFLARLAVEKVFKEKVEEKEELTEEEKAAALKAEIDRIEKESQAFV